MRTKIFFLATIFSLLCYTQSQAVPTLNIKTINTNMGLIQSDINSIAQDNEGFIWIATNGGLNRFDGIEFKKIQPKSANNRTITLFHKISVGNYNRLWISISDDVLMYNTNTEIFKSVSQTYNLTLEGLPNTVTDRDNNLWLSSRTLLYKFCYNAQEQDYTLSETIKVGKNITCLNINANNELIIGTANGIYKIENKALKQIVEDIDVVCMVTNQAFTYASGSSGTYMIKESARTENVISKKISNLIAKCLLIDDGKLLIGTKSGLFSYNIKQNTKSIARKINLNENISIKNIAKDSNGQVWIGANNGGIRIINPSDKKFKHVSLPSNSGIDTRLRSIHQDKNGNLWVGSNGSGLGFIPRGSKTVHTIFELDPIENIAHYITSFDNNIYVISNKLTKINYTQKGKNDFTFKREDIAVCEPESNLMVCRIDPQKKFIWLGSYNNGIYKYNTQSGSVSKLNLAFDKIFNSPTFIRNIIFDSHSNMWIATSKGLIGIQYSEIFKRRPKYKIYTASSDDINSLSDNYLLSLMEYNGKLWVGTFGGGLNYADILDAELNLGAFSHIDENTGILNNTIKSLEYDKLGCVWASTNKGIFRFNPENNKINNYSLYDGLQDWEFGELCSTKTPNGDLMFGGVDGLNIFTPTEITEDDHAPNTVLTSFGLLNTEIKVGDVIDDRVLFKQSINNTKEIKLNHDENSFSISFAALHHINSPQNTHSYTLEGFDTQWHLTDVKDRTAKYTNLAPGKYVFKVRTANSDNKWSEVKELEIFIRKAPWNTHFAIICYIIAFLVLAYLIYLQLSAHHHNKMNLELTKVKNAKLEEMSKMKATFFTNVSHEFRTPLSLIVTPIKQLMSNEKLDKEQVKNIYSLIDHNADILLRLINNLLDFSKFEQGMLTTKCSWKDIVMFSRETLSQFEQSSIQHNVELIFKSNINNYSFKCDYTMLEHIYYNLLSNALKHTPSAGLITMEINKLDNEISISVEDTGKGVDKEISGSLFDRYVNSDSNNSGTGLGLAYTKDLVELNGGTIKFDKTTSQGARFVISFPVEDIVDNTEHEKITQDTNNEEISEQTHNTHGIDTSEYTLLLVEDNMSILGYMEEYFSKRFKVITAQDGKQGIEMCEQHNPDIIISDVMMPNMNGNEMCSYLKNTLATSHIPIIMLTAMTKVEDQIHGYSLGADGYCAKPFDIAVLCALIVSTLENRRKTREQFQLNPEANTTSLTNNNIDQEILNKCIDYVNQNLANSELSVNDLTEHCSLTLYLLNKKLKSLTGLSANSFIRNIRLKKAAELLIKTNDTISGITFQVGFNDLRYFRACFAELFALTPSEYKKQNKAE